ncbi:MAG: DUF2723 domain-containing protein [Deltaproteobacteria bacterium]|nr:DUF2723 domain-containing protein [Deltaproteobacteria bacterium]
MARAARLLRQLTVWVNHHNLFTLLGAAWLRLMPASLDPHYSLNLLCAGLASVTVYLVFRIGIALTDDVWSSALGACVLMVSHSLWWHATMLEVYTLSTALLSATLLFVVRYDRGRRLADLAWAVFFFGLCCSNHPQMGLVGAGFLGLLAFSEVRAQVLRPKPLLILTGCFLAGFSVYLAVFGFELAARVAGSADRTVADVVRRMLHETSGGDFKQHMFPRGLGMRQRLFWWGYWLALLVYNFPPPWLLAAPAGVGYAWRRVDLRVSFAFLGWVLAAQILWSTNYLVWDMWAFSLPVYLCVGVLVIVGIAGFARRGRAARFLLVALAPTVALTPWIYARAADLASQRPWVMSELSRIPQLEQAAAFWEPLDYFLDPNKRGYDRVERTSSRILEALEPDACFWGNEATAFYPLRFYYQDVLGRRPDVSYHLIFGMTGNSGAYRRHAARMVEQLRRGCPVYISSLAYPDRAVLEHAYAQLDPQHSVADARRLSAEELVETFPLFMVEPIVVESGDGIQIYRLRRRAPR